MNSKHFHKKHCNSFIWQEVISSTVNKTKKRKSLSTKHTHTLTFAKRLLPVLSLCRLYSNSLWHTFSMTSMNLRSLWKKTEGHYDICTFQVSPSHTFGYFTFCLGTEFNASSHSVGSELCLYLTCSLTSMLFILKLLRASTVLGLWMFSTTLSV